mmetsp:Transcript_100316/g.312604  ORF Transcript_100316/g.312604 Transcript_100316/m.312604 type:complete len:133 (-) Transcript_100316:56-454(-)
MPSNRRPRPSSRRRSSAWTATCSSRSAAACWWRGTRRTRPTARTSAQGAKMKADISDLEARVAKAKTEVDGAMKALAGAYTEATATSFVELEAEQARARQRVLQIERALASNDELREKARAKLAAVQRHGVA